MIKQAQLPALTGSEKQIVWATRLRNETVSQLNNDLSKAYDLVNNNSEEAYRPKFIHAVELQEASFVQVLQNRTSAKFWIDTFVNGFKLNTACAGAIEQEAQPIQEKLKQEWEESCLANAIYATMEEANGQYRARILETDGKLKKTVWGKRSEIYATVHNVYASVSQISKVEFIDNQAFAERIKVANTQSKEDLILAEDQPEETAANENLLESDPWLYYLLQTETD